MENFTQYRLVMVPIAKLLPSAMATENSNIQRLLRMQKPCIMPEDNG